MSKSKIEILKQNLVDLDAEFFVVEKEKFKTEFENWLKTENFESVAVTNEKFLEKSDVIKIVKETSSKLLLPPEMTTPFTAVRGWRSSLAEVDAGITSAVAIAAETGSALLLSGIPDQRLVSLLPPVHIIVINENQIVDNVSQLMEKWIELENISVRGKNKDVSRTESGIPKYDNNIVLDDLAVNPPVNSTAFMVTGPSRTADIEKELVLGVHGPERVIVYVLE